MRVEYENRFTDWLVFITAHQFRMAFLQAGVVLLALLAGADSWLSHGALRGILTALLCYLLAWLFQLTVNAIYLLWRDHDSSTELQVVEIRPQTLYAETRTHKIHYAWSEVLRVVRRGGIIVVQVSPGVTHLVPVRAFREPAQANEFVTRLQERITQQP